MIHKERIPSDSEVAEQQEHPSSSRCVEFKQSGQDRDALREDILTEHEVARLWKLSVPQPINILESTTDRIVLENRHVDCEPAGHEESNTRWPDDRHGVITPLPDGAGRRQLTDPVPATRPESRKPHGHLGELSTKGREQLLDALGRCYIEAALVDLLSELKCKDSDLQPVSGSEGNTSATVAHQTDRAHEAARR